MQASTASEICPGITPEFLDKPDLFGETGRQAEGRVFYFPEGKAKKRMTKQTNSLDNKAPRGDDL